MALKKIVGELYVSSKNPLTPECDNPAKHLIEALSHYAYLTESPIEPGFSAEFNNEENTLDDLRFGEPDMIKRRVEGVIISIPGGRIVITQDTYLPSRLGFASVCFCYQEDAPQDDVGHVRKHIIETGLRRLGKTFYLK